MAESTGTATYVQWTWGSAGTLSLNGDYRKAGYTPSIDLKEQTAGSDTAKTYMAFLKDGKFNVSGVMQALGTPTGGTCALGTAVVEGMSGTIVYGPIGSAVGAPKQTFPAISLGIVTNPTYNDIVEFSIDFQQNGARTDGTF